MQLRGNIFAATVTALCLFSTALIEQATAQQPENGTTSGQPTVQEKIVIDKIWSAVRAGFCLLTHGDNQYVAYYNSDRRMVVAMRKLSDKEFTKTVLPSSTDTYKRGKGGTMQGWDSHNYITMAVDADGYIHVAGNMHVDPLLYFRSEKSGDTTVMKKVDTMVGSDERRCTYPKFMKGPDGNLIFHYRDGSSGNGREIYNIYDVKTKTWRRFFDKSLIDGLGKRNAYQNGPRLGPDGWYHLLWVWRETPDAATNHDLSYARSRDMIHWETAAGAPLTLPITIESKGTIVDPIPVKGGIINGCDKFAFDSKNRLVVTYHKHDASGNTQAYAARFVGDKWLISQISDWKDRHVFEGGGSGPSTFGTSISLGSIEQHSPGKLALSFGHWKEGSGLLLMDEETLAPLGAEKKIDKAPRFPKELAKIQSDFPGMGIRWANDLGPAPDKSSTYMLRWETLGSNRDRPREGALPENSDLVLYKIGN